MTFQQLYYTSCEHGVGGHAGFQFNALSQGVGTRVMREVEQLTVYELPSWDSSPADAPMNLCHVPDAVRGGAITANVVYAGADFSGRAGNYFAHALVTEDPDRDFGGLLPVELWESPVWSRTAVGSTILPAIEGAPPRGSLDRPAVAAFVGTQDDAEIVLARLLSAVDRALDGGRPLVLWSPTSTDNARWIAAVSYLLEGARARAMSFFTYTRRPGQCRAHVIGTVPGAVTSPGALVDSFQLFDMTARTMPDLKTHPLADLLAQVGVLHAAGLWRQAATLAAGTERSFDDWYAIAAAAAALLGIEPLPSAAIDAIADWLPQAAVRSAPLAAPHVETVLTVLLDRHGELRDDRLRALLPTANAAGAIGQLQRIEVVLLDRAIKRLERGLPPRGPTPMATAEGTQRAVASCERLLGTTDPVTMLTVLDWAQESRLYPDPQLLGRCGRDVIGLALEVIGDDRRVIRVGQAYPAFAHGLAAHLAASGPDTARKLLGGVAGELLDRSDLRRYPELRRILLLEEVRSGRLPPVQALREMVELRPAAATPPLSDKHLLAYLWPCGLQTAGEAAELLWLLDGDLRGTPALELLDDALQQPPGTGDLDAWLDLCAQTLTHPVCSQLPPATRKHLKALRGLGDMLRNARHALEQGDPRWDEGLHKRIEELPEGTRDLLRQRLAGLILAAPAPADQLAICSWPVFDAACARARTRLSASRPDYDLAARLFRALCELRDNPTPRGQQLPRAEQLEQTVLVPTVARWSRGDRGHVTTILKQQTHSLLKNLVVPGSRVPRSQRPADVRGDFKLWCKHHAGEGSRGTGAGHGGEFVTALIRGWRRPGPR